jgi:hypothetical protein
MTDHASPSRAGRILALTLLLAAWVAAPGAVHAGQPEEPLQLRMAQPKGSNPLIAYRTELIRLAMKASGQAFTLSPCDVSDAPTSDLRNAELVRAGEHCNLLATSAGSRMTQGLLAIAFPIYLGGGGYRVLMANPRGLAEAASVRDLEDLKRYRIGSGYDWVDSDIFQSNGFEVVRGHYLNLFEMLKADRFDYLNRSVFEAWGELARYAPEGELAVVPDLLIVYPEDLFFYTTPGRQDIHDSLLKGLRKLYASGALARLIEQHPSTREARHALSSARLRVLRLQNHSLNAVERRALDTYTLQWLR